MTTTMTTTTLALALLLGSSALVACAPAPLEPGDLDPDGRPSATVAPDDRALAAEPPRALTSDGGYALRSALVVESGALLPPTAYDALQTLEGLRDHPAETLFALAERAGVPAVGTLRDALPSALESRLDGWIDAQVRSVTTGDGTIAQVMGTILAIAHAEVAQVHLDSQLALAGGSATHRLDTVELEVMGRALAYDVAALAGLGVELEVTVPATVTVGATGTRLALGDHGFGLPYGRIAWRAMEDLVAARYGRDLRTVLGDQVGCPAVAAAVASQCVLGVCVGHASDLRAICEAGLDRAVSELRARVESATVEPIALDAGAALLIDGSPADGVASALDAGTWTARLDLGQGRRPTPATFTGARQ